VVKLPLDPALPLVRRPGDLHRLGRSTAVWRVHPTAGPYVTPWDRLRFVGPTTSRFDPQPPPLGRSDRGVTYASLDVATVLAEAFQSTRVVDVHRRAPYLTGWPPARTLTLLDLTGTWPIRNGASHLLTTGPKAVCRAWARAIDEQWPDLDGLWTVSTMTGRPTVVLFTAAADAFPRRPAFSRPLSTPALQGALAQAAAEIGYRVV
jgi:hypothetical protein